MNVRLLGLRTLACGCVVGEYLDLREDCEVDYVEAKGSRCFEPSHRCNRTIPAPSRNTPAFVALRPARVA